MKMRGSKQRDSDTYSMKYLQSVVANDIPKLPKSVSVQIKRAIEERLAIDPVGFGKPLRYSLKGMRRLRVGDYRVLYHIKGNRVIISAIKHRKVVYEDVS